MYDLKIDQKKVLVNTLPKVIEYQEGKLIVAKDTNLKEVVKITLTDNSYFLLDVKKNVQIKIIVELDDTQIKMKPSELNFAIGDNSIVEYVLISNLKSQSRLLQSIMLKASSNLRMTNILLNQVTNTEVTISLDESGAETTLNSLIIGNQATEQVINLNLLHNATYTSSEMTNVAITTDTANIKLVGLNQISQGMKKSSSFQNLTGINLSNQASISVDPILVINENDVKAGHAATVGKMDEEALFYLQSRGLNQKEATKLLVNGKIRPIIDKLDDLALEEKILNMINERL